MTALGGVEKSDVLFTAAVEGMLEGLRNSPSAHTPQSIAGIASAALKVIASLTEERAHANMLLDTQRALLPAQRGEGAVDDVERAVCDEIKRIMQTYREQEAERGYVDTPGGLEHMGDVWRLFSEWDDRLRAAIAALPRSNIDSGQREQIAALAENDPAWAVIAKWLLLSPQSHVGYLSMLRKWIAEYAPAAGAERSGEGEVARLRHHVNRLIDGIGTVLTTPGFIKGREMISERVNEALTDARTPTPDATITSTVERCAKVAENYIGAEHEGNADNCARWIAKDIRALAPRSAAQTDHSGK